MKFIIIYNTSAVVLMTADVPIATIKIPLYGLNVSHFPVFVSFRMVLYPYKYVTSRDCFL